MANPESNQIDPNKEHLGRIYAKALLAASETSGDTAAVVEQFEALISDVLDRLPAFAEYLKSPRVALEAKAELIDRSLSKSLSPTLVNFLKVVARRGRMEAISEMAAATRKQYNESRGVVDVEVRVSGPLDEATLQRVSSAVTRALGKEVHLHVHVDETLLGGIVLRIGDRVYDGSVVTRLANMRQQVRERTFQQIRSAIEQFAGDA